MNLNDSFKTLKDIKNFDEFYKQFSPLYDNLQTKLQEQQRLSCRDVRYDNSIVCNKIEKEIEETFSSFENYSYIMGLSVKTFDETFTRAKMMKRFVSYGANLSNENKLKLLNLNKKLRVFQNNFNLKYNPIINGCSFTSHYAKGNFTLLQGKDKDLQYICDSILNIYKQKAELNYFESYGDKVFSESNTLLTRDEAIKLLKNYEFTNNKSCQENNEIVQLDICDVIKKISHLTNKLFSVEFSNINTSEVDENVFFVDVFYENELKGTVEIDFFNREFNTGGGRCIDIQRGSKHTKGKWLIFSDQHNLTNKNLNILMHEFGHLCHRAMSCDEYIDLSGTIDLARDVVEIPSMFLELFAYNDEFLNSVQCPNQQIVSRSNVTVPFALFDLQLFNNGENTFSAYWKYMSEEDKALTLGCESLHLRRPHFYLANYQSGYYGYYVCEQIAKKVYNDYCNGDINSLKLLINSMKQGTRPNGFKEMKQFLNIAGNK